MRILIFKTLEKFTGMESSKMSQLDNNTHEIERKVKN